MTKYKQESTTVPPKGVVFKTPLHITGTPEQLKVVEEGLIRLGYELSNPIGDEFLKTECAVFWRTDYIHPHEDEIEVSASNPELVLALAAMSDDELGIEGEWVVIEDGQYVYDFTIGKLYKLGGEFYHKYSGFQVVSDDKGLANGNQTTKYRKATKEEIIKHFNNMAHFGDKKVPSYKVETREITGYKLVKEEYALAAVRIEGYLFTGDSNITDRIFRLEKHKDAIEKWRKAGVLGLWFEPVYKEDKKVITLRHYGGTFEVEVSKEGVYYAKDNKWLDVAELRHVIVQPIKRVNSYHFQQSHIDSGCMKAVPVEDWRLVLEAYNSMK